MNLSDITHATKSAKVTKDKNQLDRFKRANREIGTEDEAKFNADLVCKL